MDKVEKVRDFGDAYEGSSDYLDYERSKEVNTNKDAEDKALQVLFNKEQILAIKQAIQETDKGCFKYFKPEMSVKKIQIMRDCYSLGEQYAKDLSSYELSDDCAEAALYAYNNDFNMTEQLANGETPEHVKMITDAVNCSDFKLMDYFDETGSFLNYKKLKNFLLKQ